MMHLLIDYENVNYCGLNGIEYLTDEDSITFFFSNSSNKIPKNRMQQILDSGCKFDICKLANTGKNAVDFYIASAVGEIFAHNPNVNIGIVSEDKGFKAVRDYWLKRMNPSSRLVARSTIAACIISSAEKTERKIPIKNDYEKLDLEKAFNEYKKNQKTRMTLMDYYAGTEFEAMVPQIMEIIESGPSAKLVYINLLKAFGRSKGLELYRGIKGNI